MGRSAEILVGSLRMTWGAEPNAEDLAPFFYLSLIQRCRGHGWATVLKFRRVLPVIAQPGKHASLTCSLLVGGLEGRPRTGT